MVFGIYFGLGLAYFETFDFGEKSSILVQMPVFGLMSLSCMALAWLLFGGKRKPVQSARAISLIALPLLVFGLAAVLLSVYASQVTEAEFSGALLYRVVFHMLLVGLLPVVAALVYLQGRKGGRSILSARPEAGEGEQARAVYSLPTGPGGEGFEVALDELIMVEAADNYCKFHCLTEGQRKVKTFRIAMKEVAQSLEQEPRFHRSHRSFLINAAMLEEIQGVSQAYKLKLRQVDEPVPVSRSFDIGPLRAILEGNG
jgi:DNA-binding LytR/AlgR family response regulator